MQSRVVTENNLNLEDFEVSGGKVSLKHKAPDVPPSPPSTPSTDGVPIGTVVDFAGVVCPENWMFCNGATLDKDAYPELYKVLGDMYKSGANIPEGMFRIPDAEGRYIRAAGQSVTEPNKIYSAGETHGDAIRNITGGIVSDSSAGIQFFERASSSGAFGVTKGFKQYSADLIEGSNDSVIAFDFDASRSVPVAAETQPVTLVLYKIIKVK